MTTAVGSEAERTPVGALLRDWRERRRFSQLELALKAGSSARHISFVETGRARPSRAMVLRLAEHLDVPMRDRNALLVAAGYAPACSETPLGDRAMDAVRTGLDRLLTAYEPNPALVMDGTYTVLAANRGVRVLLGGLPGHLLRPPLNAVRLTLHPEGLASRVRNLPEWRAHLLERVERRIALSPSPALRRLHEEVVAYPEPEPGGYGPEASPPSESDGFTAFALPLRIEVEGRLLSFLTTATTFNSPMDVTVSELALETFLPADPETAAALRALVDASPDSEG